MTPRRWRALRWLFLVAVVAGAWWSWHASGPEVAAALGEVSAVRVLAALGLVVVGLLLTGVVWVLSLAAFGVTGTPRASAPPFFVAQLGKYIPGSVWSFAAQGALGASQGLPPRVPAAAAVLFLGVHVASGLVVVGVLGWWTALPVWAVAVALLVGLVGLLPVVYRVLGRRLAGRDCHWGAARSLRGVMVMVPVWGCYSAALVFLAPEPSAASAITLGCAFAIAFAVGVAVPIAPAGLGARDGVLVVLAIPLLGAGPAGVVAVLARLLHTAADFLVAGVSWWLMRASATHERSGGAPDDH